MPKTLFRKTLSARPSFGWCVTISTGSRTRGFGGISWRQRQRGESADRVAPPAGCRVGGWPPGVDPPPPPPLMVKTSSGYLPSLGRLGMRGRWMKTKACFYGGNDL